MKRYEFSMLVRPEFEGDIDAVVEKTKKVIIDNGGKVVDEENDGKKRMQYSIKGQDYAVYYYMTLELPAAAPAKVQSVLNITDELLRVMIVAEDERKLKYAEKQAARKQHEENKED